MGADEAGYDQPEYDPWGQPTGELQFVAAELTGDDKPCKSGGSHHEDVCGKSAAQCGRLHIAEGEHERRARQTGGDAGKRGGKAGSHLDGRVAADSQAAKERDGSCRGQTPDQKPENFVADRGENGEASSQTKRESYDAMAHCSAVGVPAFDDSVPEPHDLAYDDKRSGSEPRVDSHQSWPGDEGRSESQRAVHHSPGCGEADDDEDLQCSQNENPDSSPSMLSMLLI